MVGSYVVGHLARRGYEAVTMSDNSQDRQFEIEQLKKAAQLYEDTPGASMEPIELLPMLLTAIAFFVLYISVRYTLGEVVSTLAMIEQPQHTIVQRSTRVVDEDNGDPDAPLEKEEKVRLIDEEVIIIKQELVTSSLRKTMRHLHSVGGFTARWRGLGVAMAYEIAHSVAVNFMCAMFNPLPMVQAVAYIASSVILCRLHMTWTHVIISNPSPKPWFRRSMGDSKAFKALVLPSAVYATAQVLTLALPMIAYAVFTSGVNDAKRQVLGMVVAGATMLGLSVLILLPASVTLTRIEASFLAEDEDTIVPFDRTLNGAKTAAVALDDGIPSPPASGKSLFIEAWRSFDMSSRLRLIKFYVKMAAVQFMIVLVGAHVIMAEMWLLGIERLSILAQAGSAQLRLAAMGVDMD